MVTGNKLSFLLLFFIGVYSFSSAQVLDGRWGYLKLEQWKANLFYWFYQAEGETTAARKPLIFFIPGGPGLSGTMADNFLQTGPQDRQLYTRYWTWRKHANLLYVDAPGDSGFSYSEAGGNYSVTSSDIADQCFLFLKEFLVKNPAYKTVPLFLYGHSFGGNVAPHVALRVIKEMADLNLKGVILAAPLVSTIHSMTSYSDFLLPMGLVDESQFKRLKTLEKQYLANREIGDKAAAANTIGDYFKDLQSTNVNLNNILHWDNPEYYRAVAIQNKLSSIKSVIAAKTQGKLKDQFNAYDRAVQGRHWQDTVTSESISYVEELLVNTDVDVSVITGQLDANVNLLGTQRWIENLTWPGKDNYKMAPSEAMKENKDSVKALAYKKSGGNLNFYHVLEAGHEIPMDQPKVMFRVMEEFMGIGSSTRLTQSFCFSSQC